MLQDSAAFSGFSVDDLEAARRFYRETLGVEVSDEPAGLALHLGGDTTVFAYPKESHVPATFTILNFPVADIDAAVDGLTARGVSFLRYGDMPQDDKGVLRGRKMKMGPDIAWFTDPAGNILSVLQSD